MRLAAAAMPGPSATNSLERALVLLELLARHPGGLTNADISRRLHIATSTSSYILRRLERWEYVRRDTETGTYEIGLRVVALAQGALQSLGLRQVVKPMLHSLVEQTRLTAVIAVLDHGQAMVVERVDTPEFVRVDVAVGARLPVHCTSLGKILIANLPKEQLASLIAAHGTARRTPNTIVSRARLIQELEIVRRQGYAVSEEEHFLGVRAIAAPIVDSSGAVIAAVSATGLITQPVWSRPRGVIELVKVTARDISRRMNSF
jgi:IclR family KDG regulon transcriptional repressor